MLKTIPKTTERQKLPFIEDLVRQVLYYVFMHHRSFNLHMNSKRLGKLKQIELQIW